MCVNLENTVLLLWVAASEAAGPQRVPKGARHVRGCSADAARGGLRAEPKTPRHHLMTRLCTTHTHHKNIGHKL